MFHAVSFSVRCIRVDAKIPMAVEGLKMILGTTPGKPTMWWERSNTRYGLIIGLSNIRMLWLTARYISLCLRPCFTHPELHCLMSEPSVNLGVLFICKMHEQLRDTIAQDFSRMQIVLRTSKKYSSARGTIAWKLHLTIVFTCRYKFLTE